MRRTAETTGTAAPAPLVLAGAPRPRIMVMPPHQFTPAHLGILADSASVARRPGVRRAQHPLLAVWRAQARRDLLHPALHAQRRILDIPGLPLSGAGVAGVAAGAGLHLSVAGDDVLVDFPIYDQLHSPTDDGQPDENARMNCVAASVGMVLGYFDHKRYSPDGIKDRVYGQGYLGPQAAMTYLRYMATQGVALVPFYAPAGGLAQAQAALVSFIHASIKLGHPVILTMPSQWGIAPPDPRNYDGWSHVGVAYGEGPGWLLIANPWGGFAQHGSDAWWAQRLLYNAVYAAVPIGTGGNMGVPAGWHDDPKADRLYRPDSKFFLTQGSRWTVLNFPGGWRADDVPLENSHGAVWHDDQGKQYEGTETITAEHALRWVKGSNTVNVVPLGPILLTERADRAKTPPPPPASGPSASQHAVLDAAHALVTTPAYAALEAAVKADK